MHSMECIHGVLLRISVVTSFITRNLSNKLAHMAANYDNQQVGGQQEEADSDHDSWAGDIPEDPEEAAEIDRRVAERAAFFQHRLAHNDWCTCNGCWPVVFAQSHHDVKCCQEIQEAREACQDHEQFGDLQPYNCIAHHPTFLGTCLYERFLLGVEHNYHVPGVDLGHMPRNERLRYVAYRVFSQWIHGRLGRWNRVEIPQCVTAAVRRRYPDGAMNYTGFQEADRK